MYCYNNIDSWAIEYDVISTIEFLFNIVFRFNDESVRFEHQNEVAAQNESL